jgi:hypothetical protein
VEGLFAFLVWAAVGGVWVACTAWPVDGFLAVVL